MSRLNIDKYDIKNASLPKSDERHNIIGYRDNLIVKENYFMLKLVNYSNVGWVFGLAQYGTTPITTAGGTTEQVYALTWEDSVTFFGNNEDILTYTDMNVSTGYKNLQFTATAQTADLQYLLLLDTNSIYKHFIIKIDSELVDTERYDFKFKVSAESNYETSSLKLENGLMGINLYSFQQVNKLILDIFRNQGDTTYNTQKIKQISIEGFDGIQPYKEDFTDLAFINQSETTGTISNKRWDANNGDTLVSRCIYLSPNQQLYGIALDFRGAETNLDFDVDEFYVSFDGEEWTLIDVKKDKVSFDVETRGFPYVFPILLGPYLSESGKYRLYYKIVAKQDGKYIDCSGEDANFKIWFYLN